MSENAVEMPVAEYRRKYTVTQDAAAGDVDLLLTFGGAGQGGVALIDHLVVGRDNYAAARSCQAQLESSENGDLIGILTGAGVNIDNQFLTIGPAYNAGNPVADGPLRAMGRGWVVHAGDRIRILLAGALITDVLTVRLRCRTHVVITATAPTANTTLAETEE